MGKFINETGNVYGKLKVIKEDGRDKRGRAKWLCACDCGSEISLSGTHLKQGIYRSCGCVKFERLRDKHSPGEVFGELTIIRPVGRGGNWECACSCSKVEIYNGSALRKGKKSCGHLGMAGSGNPLWTGYEDISGRYWLNVQNGAKLRGHEFTITLPDMWNLYVEQGGLCALSGLPIQLGYRGSIKQTQTASIDRINSTIGYVAGNVHWVHLQVNLMKQKLSVAEFITLCKAVADNNRLA